MYDDPELGDKLEVLEELADLGYLDKEKSAFGVAILYSLLRRY